MVSAAEILGVKAGKVQDGLAHGLARDGSRVDADTADGVLLFDHSNAFPGFRALDGSELTSRPGADNDQIIALHLSSPRWPMRANR